VFQGKRPRGRKNVPNDAEILAWRARLLAERDALLDEDAQGAEDRGTVMLDQTSVGRLSRIDAMQRQAMAEATHRRRAARQTRIDAALARLEEGEFGYCIDCGETIAAKRLELDPTIPTCVSCAKG
jgi:DnaK suppressor protein